MRRLYLVLIQLCLVSLACAQIISPDYQTSSGTVCDIAGDYSLGCIALRMANGGEILIQLLLSIAFVSGWGFVIAAIFKFKQVRENPTQVPVSTPFAFLLTAILLIFIPGLMNTTSSTVFGSEFSAPGNQGQLFNTAGTSDGLLVGGASKEVSVTIESDTENNLFAMAYRVLGLFPVLMSIIVGGAYIAGLGFALVAMTKLKAVKDNPQQNTPTLPLAYLAIAVLLIYIPELIAPSSETLFGSSEAQDEQGGALGQGADLLLTGTDD